MTSRAPRKGNLQLCDNHRGIFLLEIAGKRFARIPLNLLNNDLEQGLLPESQCSFRRHRGTTNMIFAARQMQEKCQEMRTHLYPTFLDLTKAFDSVNRERCRQGFPPTNKPSSSLQGHSEDFPEASANQPGQVRRPRPIPADLEEDSEDRRSHLQSEPPHRRQSQTRGSEIPTASTTQLQRSTTPDLPTLPADVPAPIGLVGHPRTNCSTRTTPAVVSRSNSSSPSTPTASNDRIPEPSLPSSSSSTA
ncbi:hypothetical protein SprV_0100190400 [Sparganum proliferum]